MMRASFLIVATMALASSTSALAQAVTIQDLQAELARRDAVISALQQRVAALEAGPRQPSNQPAPSFAASAPAAADEAGLEALSRGLVARGAVLLPAGSVELSPALSYSHSQMQGLVLVDTPEGISTVSDQRQRDDGLEGALTARVGLPWRSQLQLRMPFGWRREVSSLGDGTEVGHHFAGVGDLELELSHQFLSDQGLRPTVIGAVGWRFPTGRDPFQSTVASVASGSGTHQATARVTVLKAVDPLMLFTTLSYAANLSRREDFGRIHPGDTIAWQLGGLLAVSPDTSLSFGFSQQFKRHTSVDGATIPGSDGVAAVAQFGLDQVLTAHTLLDVSFGVGLTRDAPDYQLAISLPIRL